MTNEEFEKLCTQKGLDIDVDLAAEHMTELLRDENWSTYKMYEDLLSSWLNGSEDYRKGLDDALSTLTGWNLKSITKQLLTKAIESGKIEADDELKSLLEVMDNE